MPIINGAHCFVSRLSGGCALQEIEGSRPGEVCSRLRVRCENRVILEAVLRAHVRKRLIVDVLLGKSLLERCRLRINQRIVRRVIEQKASVYLPHLL